MSRWGANTGVVQKAIRENPKYKNVRPRVDSGASIRRYIERIHESQRNIKQKNDEVFKRIKVTSFVKLIVEVFNEALLCQYKEPALNFSRKSKLNEDTQNTQVEKQSTVIPFEQNTNSRNHISSITNINGDIVSNNEKTYNLNIDASVPRAESVTSVSSVRSTLHNVITGTGEMDIKRACNNGPSDISQNTHREPYILLDVRDSDAYRQCHIITSKSYPYSMLIRTCNYETRDMLACKNAKDKIIVLYDEDESIAPRVATTLVQRGYSNIFMLSGGLKLALYKFPEGLIKGIPPLSCQQESSSMQNNSTSKLITKIDEAIPSKLNCFTADNIQALQEHLKKCLAVESLSLEYSRSAPGFVRKSSYHRQLISHSTKGRVIPWK